MHRDIHAEFKASLRRDAPLHGFFVGPPSAMMVELVGYAGFDFVIVDTEHGPAGLETLENMIRAAEAAGVASLVRVPSASSADILHALDAGATGILVPHVTDAAVARAVVDCAYYPPRGRRGISTMSRAARHGLAAGADYIAGQAARTTVMVMIEDREALPHAEAIAQVEGIDAIFVGPSDLAASMGHPGNPGHPEVAAALADLWPRLRSVGGPARATTARSAADAGRLLQAGIGMICFNAVHVLATGLRDLRQQLERPPI